MIEVDLVQLELELKQQARQVSEVELVERRLEVVEEEADWKEEEGEMLLRLRSKVLKEEAQEAAQGVDQEEQT